MHAGLQYAHVDGQIFDLQIVGIYGQLGKRDHDDAHVVRWIVDQNGRMMGIQIGPPSPHHDLEILVETLHKHYQCPKVVRLHQTNYRMFRVMRLVVKLSA